MEDLLIDFDTTTEVQWKVRLEKDLKGITFEQLQRLDDNGITIDPFYTIETAQSAKALFQHSDWTIMEQILVTDEKAGNATALSALRSGTGGLFFKIQKEDCNWSALLEGIELNYIETVVEWGASNQEQALKTYLDVNGIQENAVHWGVDNLANYFATKDNSYHSNIGQLSSDGTLYIDGSLYYNSGANSVSQLANITAQVQEALHLFQEKGLLKAIGTVHVKLAVGTAFFEEIAKFRALRQLMALLLEQYDIDVPVKIFAITGSLYKAEADAYSNLLRDTLSGMAAVMGGCDALCILPFDEKSNKGNPGFSQRMSINQQLLMKEESYLNQMADVAHGSFYLEQLTSEFATKAWAQFKNVEQQGGILNFFEAGKLQQEIETQAEGLVADFQTGQKIWIGLNKYPNASDMPTKVGAPKSIAGAINPLEIAAHLSFS